MEDNLNLMKGIHPGVLLAHELKRRKIPKSRFALSIHEYPQVFGDITKGKRKMNIPLSLKIEHALGLEEGYLMTLQVFYDIKQEKLKQTKNIHPDLSKIRAAVFWDTDIKKIDWINQKQAVIQRVLERGNAREKNELEHFYGKEEVDKFNVES